MDRRKRTGFSFVATLLTFLILSGIGQAKRDPEEPKAIGGPPGSLIEVVEGQRFSLLELPFPSGTSKVRLSIPSVSDEAIIGDAYEPGAIFNTVQLRPRGIKADFIYDTLVATAFKSGGTQEVVATYKFLMHSLPTVAKVHISALILRGRPHLVGLKLSNIGRGDRVKAWGFGFGASGGPFEIHLKLTRSTESFRTYTIPGGLRWARKSNPKIKLNVAPRLGAKRWGVLVRGRLLAGVFRTNLRGNTVFRKTDHWKRCTTTLTNEKFAKRPPFPESCVHMGWNRWNQP